MENYIISNTQIIPATIEHGDVTCCLIEVDRKGSKTIIQILLPKMISSWWGVASQEETNNHLLEIAPLIVEMYISNNWDLPETYTISEQHKSEFETFESTKVCFIKRIRH